MQAKIKDIVENGMDDNEKLAAKTLLPEFDKLLKQVCPYCDGFGHAGKDCPTDFKISQLRGGVHEQNKVLQLIRNLSRVAANMKGVSGFSLISSDPGKTLLGRRKRTLRLVSKNAANGHSDKRPKL